jgi:hypothetical protein
MMVIIASLMYFAHNFIYCTNPRVSSKEKPSGSSETFRLNNSNMIFAFRVEGLDPKDILNNKWLTADAYMKQTIFHDFDGNSVYHKKNL